MQTLAHTNERLGHFADLAVLAYFKRKCVVTFSQRSHALDEIFQWTGKGAVKKVDEQASEKHRT